MDRIKLLAARGFYDNLAWHRVIDWFMAQTGDPLGTGDGQSWYPDLKAEFTFRRGADMAFNPVAAPVGALVGFVDSIPVQTQPDDLMAGVIVRRERPADHDGDQDEHRGGPPEGELPPHPAAVDDQIGIQRHGLVTSNLIRNAV